MKIGLVQINSTVNQNYLPYSVGLLQAYVQQYASQQEKYHFLLPIYAPVTVAKAIQGLAGANIVGFSTYIWNIRRSLAIAQALKEKQPQTPIVFGGPQVPDQAESFLKNHPFIDLCCHGPGEAVFLKILEGTPWPEIPGISYIKDGIFIHQPRASRIPDLDTIPSPYLSDVFKPLMQAHPTQKWFALWETNRGCPFSCTFCDWGSAVQSKIYTFSMERLNQEIEWFAQHKTPFVFCCDANFGILQRDLDIAEALAKAKSKYGYPAAVTVQGTKNATDRAYQVQKKLHDAGLSAEVTLSLQSLTPQVLEAVKRQNISTQTFQALQQRFIRDGIGTYTDVIIGLPGETYDSFVHGVSTMIAGGQHRSIMFFNFYVLPNAEAGDPRYQEKYGLRWVQTKCLYRHAPSTSPADGIQEMLEVVIATHTMPAEDWVRAKVFGWMVGLLYFGSKILQVPLVLIHQLYGIDYGDIFTAFTNTTAPLLSDIHSFFTRKAQDIQQGGDEYCNGQEVGTDIWLAADEFIFRQLCQSGKIVIFYQECEQLLGQFLQQQGMAFSPIMLKEAIACSQLMLKLAFGVPNLKLTLSHNIPDFYLATLQGQPVALKQGVFHY